MDGHLAARFEPYEENHDPSVVNPHRGEDA